MKSYIDWVAQEALPVWAEHGFDEAAGRFHERLDASARPLAVPYRAMVQSRQIYCFAHAARLGWLPRGATLAERAFASLRRDFVRDEGAGASSILFSIDPATGAPVSEARDSYTHAFVLFALAHFYALTKDDAALALARRVDTYVQRALIDAEHGGVHDSLPLVERVKRQNPQMHLLEAYLALAQIDPDGAWLTQADELVALFRTRLGHEEHGAILEHFAEDWTAHPDPARASVFEPGHHYEWIWLLAQHEALTGANHAQWRARLGRTARARGHAPDGAIYDEVSVSGAILKASHRLWPHTEAIKAATVMHGEGDSAALPFAQTMADVLLDRFLGTPFGGAWTDQFQPNRLAMVDYVPASSLYHLFLAAAEADRVFGHEHRFSSQDGA